MLSLMTACGLFIQANSQSTPEDLKILRDQYQRATSDSTRGMLSYQLAFGYRFSDIDSSLFYTDVSISYADKLNLPVIKAMLISLKGATLLEAGKLPESLQLQFEALEIGEQYKDTANIAFADATPFQTSESSTRKSAAFAKSCDAKRSAQAFLLPISTTALDGADAGQCSSATSVGGDAFGENHVIAASSGDRNFP